MGASAKMGRMWSGLQIRALLPFRATYAVLAALFMLGTLTSLPTEAAGGSKVGKTKAEVKTRKKPGKRLSARAAAAKARAEAYAKAQADAIASARAAVFVFDGDDSAPLRAHVIRLLRANGMHVQTDLRPTDTAEQFRDMAAALDLAVYVHGRVRDTPRGRSQATITIRSGVTGQTIATARFEDERHELASSVEQGLWQKVKGPIGRTCLAALKPRRHNAPTKIEAGTPIEDPPTQSDGS